MDKTEFSRQIIKHNDIIRKNATLFDVISCIRLALFLPLGISLILMFARGFRPAAIISCLLVLVALSAVWKYHERIRERINHSYMIVKINRRHLNKLSDMWASYPDISETAVDNNYMYFGALYDDELVKDSDFIKSTKSSSSQNDADSLAPMLIDDLIGQQKYTKRKAVRFLLM